ncbi:MAG TPA: NADH-quinone oxidoreductase subunit J [Candidatus Udaeobacter sp.]|jgi:NADH-quinone oxidoreductase subunit J|nr:NADH-quinone oxidoreductase subunit J [Candidatus Udaeobacter sp.]
MTPSLIAFYVLGGLLVIASLMVVFQRNVVHSAMSLVGALFLTAILFFTLQAPMVGVLQVLVYAGAIMVLFLFVIMFLNPAAVEQRRRFGWGFGIVAALLLSGALVAVMMNSEPPPKPVAATELFGSPETLAKSLFTDFTLPFEIASVLLLVAIIGAVVLAKKEP